ncbi:MAG TPA: hypothetical protein RMH99_19965 [Sandaracinaceae bacterium LLY-WYZ-13_1]|nr:hypothetical protein [Sandaracinaceae bacterium LLY-WYZ-13_1]
MSGTASVLLRVTRSSLWVVLLATVGAGCSLVLDGSEFKPSDDGFDAGPSRDGGESEVDGSTVDDAGTNDAGSADAQTSDGGACAPPRMMCGAECVDTDTSQEHCGACDAPCAAGLSCRGGACRPSFGPLVTFGASEIDSVRAVVADAAGNVYVTGDFAGTVNLGGDDLVSDGGGDVFVASFGPDGSHRWSTSFGDTGDDLGRELTIDASDSLVVTGGFHGTLDLAGETVTSAGARDLFVAGFATTTGAARWVRGYGSSGDELGYDVASDSTGGVYVAAAHGGAFDFDGAALPHGGDQDALLMAFSTTSTTITEEWAFQAGGAGEDTAGGVAMSPAGTSICATGTYTGGIAFGTDTLPEGGGLDVWVACLTASGAYAWSATFATGGVDLGEDVEFTSDGHLVGIGALGDDITFAGETHATEGLFDIFTYSFTVDGTARWGRVLSGPSDFDIALGLAANAGGGVIVGGQFGATVTGEDLSMTSEGSLDAFAVGYDADGALSFHRSFGGAEDDRVLGIVAVGTERLWLGGEFRAEVMFGSRDRTSAGSFDAYLQALEL